jgi:hypothetical protein
MAIENEDLFITLGRLATFKTKLEEGLLTAEQVAQQITEALAGYLTAEDVATDEDIDALFAE